MNPQVDLFLEKATKWKEEMRLLRVLILEMDVLDEDYKWMHPCYTLKGKNVVLIHEFKEYCALLFHKGVLMNDPEGVFIQQTINVQAARQIRFTDINQIKEQAGLIKRYIFEAIELEKSGLKIVLKPTDAYDIPKEFQTQLDSDPDLKTAFYDLTPGRQRAYLLYFSQAKQTKTREARITKCLPKIFEGKGIND